eukprot:Sspe_Gene.115288::Locus_102293_Transcript_1_1_Confidence_1.000_Length_432::g.115288::m.115288
MSPSPPSPTPPATLKPRNAPTPTASYLLEAYAPQDESDLVSSKSRTGDVKRWLATCPTPLRRSRVMLLTGPSGSGKRSVLRVLARQMDMEIKEWTEYETF